MTQIYTMEPLILTQRQDEEFFGAIKEIIEYLKNLDAFAADPDFLFDLYETKFEDLYQSCFIYEAKSVVKEIKKMMKDDDLFNDDEDTYEDVFKRLDALIVILNKSLVFYFGKVKYEICKA